MRYIKLLLEYDGTNYHGWQSQKAGGTIQNVLRDTIRGITGEEVRLAGASRTDAGVHSLGQVAVFATESRLETEVLMRALNAKLPPDIRILHTGETDGDFHPRYHARRKSYFYILSEERRYSAFLHRYIWYVHSPLDINRMTEAASLLAGRHDFSSFRGSGCGAKHPVRTVGAADIERFDEMRFMTTSFRGNFVRFRIEADAFLRHMVRNITGTLVEVGKGSMSVEAFQAVLRSRDRTLAGPTAPARGLFLEKITY